jgi:hypothetical protein
MDSPCDITVANAVATVTLNRPEIHNAFDDTLIARLTAAFVSLDDDPDVRAVVLTGAGRSFCAGADLNWMKRMAAFGPEENLADAHALAAMLRSLYALSKPTIARVNGAAYGGGVGLVAACDVAVAVAEATFALSEAKLGLIPATIGPYVVEAIGARQARRYFLAAEGAGEGRGLRRRRSAAHRAAARSGRCRCDRRAHRRTDRDAEGGGPGGAARMQGADSRRRAPSDRRGRDRRHRRAHCRRAHVAGGPGRRRGISRQARSGVAGTARDDRRGARSEGTRRTEDRGSRIGEARKRHLARR